MKTKILPYLLILLISCSKEKIIEQPKVSIETLKGVWVLENSKFPLTIFSIKSLKSGSIFIFTDKKLSILRPNQNQVSLILNYFLKETYMDLLEYDAVLGVKTPILSGNTLTFSNISSFVDTEKIVDKVQAQNAYRIGNTFTLRKLK